MWKKAKRFVKCFVNTFRPKYYKTYASRYIPNSNAVIRIKLNFDDTWCVEVEDYELDVIFNVAEKVKYFHRAKHIHKNYTLD